MSASRADWAYEITELSTAASGETYVLVDYWRSNAEHDAGDPPYYTEEFDIQVRPTKERIATNIDGWLKRIDGVFIDPATFPKGERPTDVEWTRETVIVDVPAYLRGKIEKHWALAEERGWSGDHTRDGRKAFYVNDALVPQRANSRTLKRSLLDTHNILVRPDVQAMRGVTQI